MGQNHVLTRASLNQIKIRSVPHFGLTSYTGYGYSIATFPLRSNSAHSTNDAIPQTILSSITDKTECLCTGPLVEHTGGSVPDIVYEIVRKQHSLFISRSDQFFYT